MTDEKRILERLQNRSCDSMEEAIEIYTPYLGTVLYNMLGTSLQKEDIEELAGMFKSMLAEEEKGGDEHYITMLKDHYVPQDNFSATYLLKLDKREDSLIIVIKEKSLNCYFGQIESADVIGKLTLEVLDNIMEGRMTFQRAFMSGEMTAKGNFKTLRMLDENFVFV